MFQFSAAWCFRSIPARDGCRWLAQNGRKMDVSTLKRTDLVGPMKRAVNSAKGREQGVTKATKVGADMHG